MRDAMRYGVPGKRLASYSAEGVCCTGTAYEFATERVAMVSMPDVSVWIYGELYPDDRTNIGCPDARSFRELYCSQPDLQFLDRLNGIYSAVVHDRLRNRLLLINDRYGLKPLYWASRDQCLYWSSELKGLLPILKNPKVDRAGVRDLIIDGQLHGSRTLIEGTQLQNPGSVVVHELTDGAVTQWTYWSWDRIRYRKPVPNERDIVRELAVRFKTAVERMCDGTNRLGIALSGGLDSRAILASVPRDFKSVSAVTFGTPDSLDVQLARRACAVRTGARHRTVDIEQNWLGERIPGVWHCDGELTLLYMHGIEALPVMSSMYDVNLSGYLGDATVGGSYLDDPNASEFVKVCDRGRRLIRLGLRLMDSRIHSRCPFFDNEFLELAMSLPPSLRRYSKIYNKMLLHAFPEYFRTIPWQKTGVPISSPTSIGAVKQFLLQSLPRRMRRCRRHFADYSMWIRREPAARFFRESLLHARPLYAEFVSPDIVREEWSRHVAGENRSAMLTRYLTLEIWLQQAFERRLHEAPAFLVRENTEAA